MDTESLTRTLNILKGRVEKMKEQHTITDSKTGLSGIYWDGYNLGYLKGRIRELSELIEGLKCGEKN